MGHHQQQNACDIFLHVQDRTPEFPDSEDKEVEELWEDKALTPFASLH